ncbi:MAG: Cu(I)-responsive transcriptional regulator [Gammaproteobacteria bacterium]|nr:Cu(I)-responsive transcriptional regulator [Gammaproteobacteria bacterium]
MNIGQAARASGVSAKMIRYYEQIDLIPPTGRTEAGYRTYSQSDLHRLQFIRRARALGFSVAEIGELLSLWHDQSRQSGDVKRLAAAHLAELERRMAALQQMADTLNSLIHCCAGDQRPDCPILHNLEQPAGGHETQPVRRGTLRRLPPRRG